MLAPYEAAQKPEDVLLEAIFYAGGLKSKLFGISTRPIWLPAADRVGLHNDVFPGPGQWVADISRFDYADGSTSVRGGVTWIGVYTHAVDIYGDRGNFCGVGAWLADGITLDHERAVTALLRLAGFFQANLPRDGSATLPALAEMNCVEALAYLRDKCVLGYAEQPAGLPPAGNHAADCTYVVLGGNSLEPRDLAPVFDALLLADFPGATPRVLFVAGDDVKFDAKVNPKKRLSGLQGLIGHDRASAFLVKHLLSVSAASSQAEQEFQAELVARKKENASLTEEATELRSALEIERQKAPFAEPIPTNGLHFEPAVSQLAVVNEARKPIASAPSEPKQMRLAEEIDVASRLRSIEQMVFGIQQKLAYTPKSDPPRAAHNRDHKQIIDRWLLPAGAFLGVIVTGLVMWLAWKKFSY